MIVLVITICVLVVILLGGISQYKNSPKPPNGLTYNELRQYYYNREWEHTTKESTADVEKAERVAYLEETIIKYNKLLDSLNEQYKTTCNEQEKSKILAKQIVTMEKLTRALEKREKYD